MIIRIFIGALFFLITTHIVLSQQIYLTRNGIASFVSNAPLEVIEAASDQVEGAVNLTERTFAFTIDNKTFTGFNSSLQQEHFYENYMEIQDFPKSTFQGKIIGEIDPDSQEEQIIRAKGMLTVHGVEQERIIKGTIRINGDKLLVHAVFTIPLEDHGMNIPRIVYQKIAEIIDVTISAELTRKPG